MTIQITNTSQHYEKIKRLFVSEHPDKHLWNLIVEPALDAGAFIAGGMPRYFNKTRRFMTDYTSDQFITMHLNADSVNHYTWALSGDIDLFFRNQSQLNDTVARIKNTVNGRYVIVDSYAKLAFNVVRETQNYRHPLVQLVNCRFGEPETVIDNFDFTNSKIGFDRDHSYIHADQAEYEKAGLLHIGGPNSPFLPWRINKYFKKYNYETLHPESMSHLAEWLHQRYSDIIEQKMSQPIATLSGKNFVSAVERIINSRIEKNMSNDDLIYLTFMFCREKNLNAIDTNPFQKLIARFKSVKNMNSYSL